MKSTFLSCSAESYNLLLTRAEAAVDALNLFLLNLVRFCGPAQKSRLQNSMLKWSPIQVLTGLNFSEQTFVDADAALCRHWRSRVAVLLVGGVQDPPIVKLRSESHAGAPVSLPFRKNRKDNQSVCVYFVSLVVCLCVCSSVCLKAYLLARHVRPSGH